MDAPTPRTLLLLALGDAIAHLDGRSLDARGRTELRERLAEQLRLVEARQIGDLTREAAAWEGIDKPDGAHAARAIEDAIGDLPMPERGT